MALSINSLSKTIAYPIGGTKTNVIVNFTDTTPLFQDIYGDGSVYRYGGTIYLWTASSSGTRLSPKMADIIIDYPFDPGGSSLTDTVTIDLDVPSGLTAGGTYYVGSFSTGLRKPVTMATNDITISFNKNGGTGTTPSSLVDEPGSSFTMPSGSGFSRDGYTFLGWSTSSIATSASYLAGQSYVFNSTDVLYAVWEGNTYNVIIDENGGGDVSNPQYDTDDSSQDVTLTQPSLPTGKTFNEWTITLQPSANLTTPFTGNILTIPANVHGAINIRADWNLTSYDITYNLDGGTGVHGNPTSYNVETQTITLVQGDLEKAGYTFDGWFVGETQKTEITLGSTGNVSLTAKWTAIQRTVQFRNKFTGTDDVLQTGNTYIIGDDITYDGNTPTKVLENNKRYIFKGWNLSENDTEVLSDLGNVAEANITFYAIYDVYESGLKSKGKNVNVKRGETTQVRKVMKGSKLIWEDYS